MQVWQVTRTSVVMYRNDKCNLVLSTSWQRKLATVKNLKADVSSVRPSSERLGNDKWSEWNFVCQAQVCDLIDINTILPKAYRIVISKSISYLWIVCFQSSMEM